MKKLTHRSWLILSITLSFISFNTMSQQKKKIAEGQDAPVFITTDVYGSRIDLSQLKGRKVFLTFHRNVGCPICNLRFHEVESHADTFSAKGLVVISVYESSKENMLTYLDGQKTLSMMIPDPDEKLYDRYGIETSTMKVMKGMFHGAMSKIKRGNKLFRKKLGQDGNFNRIGADFLIDERGVVVRSYYGKFVGDHLPVRDVLEFIQ
jgi:thioredoxin-dependent peroxiredoxin